MSDLNSGAEVLGLSSLKHGLGILPAPEIIQLFDIKPVLNT